MATEKDAESDLDIIREARKLADDWIAHDEQNRTAYRDAMHFLFVDQWPEDMRRARQSGPDKRPCLTIDYTSQHINQITNEQRQNKPSIRVLPVDNEADPETAEVLGDLVRNIEQTSNADTAYQIAGDCQVSGGFGYIAIRSEVYDEARNRHRLCIEPIHNPLAVALEPGSVCPVGSDSNRWVMWEQISRRDFERQYPDAKCSNADLPQDANWVTDSTVTVGVYLRKDGDKWRSFKFGGASVLERTEWPGKHAPIVRVAGKEAWVDGKRYVKSHTASLMDPNRMLNYVRTIQAEKVALAPKAKWLMVVGQREGVDSDWQNANTSNDPVLEYNQVDLNGTPAPPPQRIAPDYVDTALNALSSELTEDMKATSGQWNQSLGQGGNATSGIAINRLQQQGDRSTFHFVDNMARAIEQVGRVLVDAIPKFYDYEDVIRVIGEDGEPREVQIGAQAQPAMPEQEIEAIYALGVGTYDVTTSVGPSFATRRQEGFAAFTQMVQANPAMWNVAGDIIARTMDAPGADELAERLKKTIDPKLLDDGENHEQQQLAQMQQMVQKAVDHIAQLEQQAQQLAEENQQLKEKANDAVIKANASIEAERLKQAGDTERKQMEVSASMAQSGAAPQDFALLFEAVARLTEMVSAQQSHLSALIPAQPAAAEQPQMQG